MDIDGIDAPRYDIVALPRPDGWDQWVDERDRRSAQARSLRVRDGRHRRRRGPRPVRTLAADPGVRLGLVADAVAVGWAPYRAGRWIWQDPWGWTWVAAEPWGWAPYHYGRWVFSELALVLGARGAGRARRRVLARRLRRPGSSAASRRRYVGWFPLAPRDPFDPWWAPRRATVNVTNVTYVNRTYVTVVNQTAFVSGRRLTATSCATAR